MSAYFRNGYYLTGIDYSQISFFGDEYIGQRIAEQYDRFCREQLCWDYIGECLRIMTRGIIQPRLIDLLRCDEPQETPETKSKAEVTDSIIAGLSAILEKKEEDA